MVESLKELNKICQKPRYKKVGNWMVRRILRPLALPITWVLVQTKVTANQVTAFSLLVGLAGIFFIGAPSKKAFLLGTLLLQGWYLFDHVDGQVARYRKTDSLTGRFFDFLTHHIIHGPIFFFLGLSVYHLFKGNHLWIVIAGFFMATLITLFNLLNDIKAKAIYEKLAARKGEKLTILKSINRDSSMAEGRKSNTLKTIFSLIHKMSEVHVLMNVLTFAALCQYSATLPFDLRIPIFFVYGITLPSLVFFKTSHWIQSQKIDSDFKELFEFSIDEKRERPIERD